MAGFFYWVSEVQVVRPADHQAPAFNFNEAIEAAAKAKNSKQIADACSGLVNRGCPAAKCDTGPVDKIGDREASTLLAVHQFLGNDWTGRLLEDSILI